jgi:hypothetical protein
MADHPFRALDAHARLARRLGLRAFTGLFGLVLVAIGFAVAALWCAALTWQHLAEGAVLGAIAAVVAFMLCVGASLRCIGWLAAPAERPDGVSLPREAAPSLHRMIDRVGSRFGQPTIDGVWVTGDMNAAILQRPRWGWIGPMETHLMIGLPLTHSVSRRQFGAILAHEFAHLAFQRQGIAAWGSHLRAWWFRVLDRCIHSGMGLAPIFEWWSTKTLPDALRLSRVEEFDADECAARVVGARLLGETLVEVALKERFLSEDYWRKVMAQSKLRPRPSIRPYREMGLGMMAGFRRPAPGADHLRSVVGEEPSPMDFHPTLLERLQALGVKPAAATSERPSAAARYLAPLLPSLAWVFDRAWWLDTRRTWRSRYERARRI